MKDLPGFGDPDWPAKIDLSKAGIIELHEKERMRELYTRGFTKISLPDGMEKFSQQHKTDALDIINEDVWIFSDNHNYFERNRTRRHSRLQPDTVAVFLHMFSSQPFRYRNSLLYPSLKIYHRSQQDDPLPNPNLSLDIGLKFRGFGPPLATVSHDQSGEFDSAEILVEEPQSVTRYVNFPPSPHERDKLGGLKYLTVRNRHEGFFMKSLLFALDKRFESEVEEPLQLEVVKDLGGFQSLVVSKKNRTVRIKTGSIFDEVEADLQLAIQECVSPNFVAALISPEDLKLQQILGALEFRLSLPKLGLEISNKC